MAVRPEPPNAVLAYHKDLHLELSRNYSNNHTINCILKSFGFNTNKGTKEKTIH